MRSAAVWIGRSEALGIGYRKQRERRGNYERVGRSDGGERPEYFFFFFSPFFGRS